MADRIQNGIMEATTQGYGTNSRQFINYINVKASNVDWAVKITDHDGSIIFDMDPSNDTMMGGCWSLNGQEVNGISVVTLTNASVVIGLAKAN